ncbi:MAG: dihydropteroate synthase [Candidatus Omnitrophica bacterium]|nr:dihydropteroate synthase [Candidatus Omnitrophota bacterium]
MIVIGELINGMYKDVSKAISNREADVIQHVAEEQVRAGANILDINTGPYSNNPKDDMKWLVENIQKVVSVQLSLDSTKIDVIEEGIKVAANRVVINSTSADDDKMSAVFELAKKYNAQVIGLAMDKTGIPNTKNDRLGLAAKIVAKATEYGISPADLYLDPIAMPVNVTQSQGREVMDAIRDFSVLSNPAPNTVIGLSNVSQGTKRHRSLLDRTFLVMALANGLTAAILDPLDKELMDAMIAAELILNKHIYCDSFLEAYRRK